MNFYKVYLRIFFLFSLLTASLASFGQITRVSGVITDAKTKQTLPYVGIATVDTLIPVTWDVNGKYAVQSSRKPFSKIKVTYVGYKAALIDIVPGKDQVIN